MLTRGNRRAEKGDCILRLRHLLAYATPDMALIAMDGDEVLLGRLRAVTPHLWLAASMPRGGGSARTGAADGAGRGGGRAADRDQ
jgi:error-prone DNA polymerase